MPQDLLLFIPTYNERDNVQEMVRRLDALGLNADLLFLDDSSPDGTGKLLEAMAADRDDFHIVHRPGKAGIGGAHLDGIAWAYDHGYQRLVTLDCDFSHSPEDIPRLLDSLVDDIDMVVGSRYIQRGSLPGWNLMRRFLTHFGHWLTVRLLGVPYDATGAFRLYELRRVPRRLWTKVRSRGYSFFFESMFLAARNGLRIREVSVALPARTYGSSKMSLVEAANSGLRVCKLWLQDRLQPEQFSIAEPFDREQEGLEDPQNWDTYWEQSKDRTSNRVYDAVATLYRNLVIERQLLRLSNRHFTAGDRLLHAGCGSGQVDSQLGRTMEITAVDISPAALRLYQYHNPRAAEVRHASIFALPYPDDQFDGVYNLGVMEHFSREEIQLILRELRRVLKPGGTLLLFWPHAWATSVFVLRVVRWILRRVLRRDVQFHPDEITYLRSRSMARGILEQANLTLEGYEFGPRDGFVQAVVIAGKPHTSNHAGEFP